MKNIFRSFVAVLAVLVGFLGISGTAAAADYTLKTVVYAKSGQFSLVDKHLRLYENPNESRAGRDGWCSVPGNKSYRGSSWSCTVSSPIVNGRAMGFDLKSYSDGDRMLVNGRMVTAHKSQIGNILPYCSLRATVSAGTPSAYNVYLCAYFV